MSYTHIRSLTLTVGRSRSAGDQPVVSVHWISATTVGAGTLSGRGRSGGPLEQHCLLCRPSDIGLRDFIRHRFHCWGDHYTDHNAVSIAQSSTVTRWRPRNSDSTVGWVHFRDNCSTRDTASKTPTDTSRNCTGTRRNDPGVASRCG